MRSDRNNRSMEREKARDREREKERERERDNRYRGDKQEYRNTFGWSKKRIPTSRSGRSIKGRGVFVSFPFNLKLSIADGFYNFEKHK